MPQHNLAEVLLEENVPVPPTRPPRYVLASMKVGQSFFVAVEDEVRQIRLLRCITKQYGRLRSMRFTSRRLTENGRLGVRCWRIG